MSVRYFQALVGACPLIATVTSRWRFNFCRASESALQQWVNHSHVRIFTQN